MNALVIGAGIAGLAAAIRLRLLGHQVTVFEANSFVGGKLSSIELGGYRFDAGPSLFTMPWLLDELFALAGRDRRKRLPILRKEQGTQCFFADGTRFGAAAEPLRFAEEAAQVLGVERQRVLDYFAHAAQVYGHLGKLFLEKPLDDPKTWFGWEALRAVSRLPQFNPLSTLHGVNQRRLREPRMVQYFDRMATYNGSSPFRAPGVLSMISHLEHNLGTFLPERGMIGITDSLFELARELGVGFELATRVTAIRLCGSRVLGVEAGRRAFPGEIVVMNGDVLHAYRDLLSELPIPETLQNRERSSSGLVFYFGIRKRFAGLQLHNVFFASDYAEEFQAIFARGDVARDPTVYVYVSSKDVPGDAPPGCENWFVMVNAPPNTGQDWDALASRVRGDVLAKLQRMLGESIASHIEVETLLDPRGLEQRTSAVGGALYGTSSNSPWSAFLRQPNGSRIRGLYFCGGTVHPGGGIPLCLMSAKMVAERVGAGHV